MSPPEVDATDLTVLAVLLGVTGIEAEMDAEFDALTRARIAAARRGEDADVVWGET